MKKHLLAGLTTAVLVLCGTQPSAAAGFNPQVNAAAGSAHSSAAHNPKYNAEAQVLLGELKIVLAALQQDVAAMKSGTQDVAARIAHVETTLDRVETHVIKVPSRNNVWVRGPRRSGP